MEILKTVDRTKISKVTFKFPELMGNLDKTERLIRDEYQKILDLESSIQNARKQLWEAEEKLKEQKKVFQDKQSMFDIEFEVKEKEYTTEKCSLMLKGHGNDIIGLTNVMA